MKKEFWFSLIFICLSCLFAVAATEVTLRFISPSWLRLRMNQLQAGGEISSFGTDKDCRLNRIEGDVLGFVPSSECRLAHYEYDFIAHFDRRGARVSSQKESSSDEQLVPVLGDSFAFGLGVNDNETFVSLLNQTRGDAYFVNLGIPGCSLHQQLTILEKRHEELGKPSRYIFAFFLGNDFHGMVSNYREKSLSSPQEPGASRKQSRLRASLDAVNGYVYHHPVFKRSYLIQFVRVKLLRLFNKVSSETRMDPIFRIMDVSNHQYQKLARVSLSQQLDRLERLQEQLGFKAFFIIIPDRHQVYDTLLSDRIAYYGFSKDDISAQGPNRIIAQALQERGIPFCDVTDALRSAGDRLYYELDNHMTAAGHRVVARCVKEKLQEFVKPERGAL